MCEQLQAISKYYNNLQYDESKKEEALAKISTLSKTIKIKDDISERFFETVFVIEKNLSLFQSVCEHVDVVTTIIEYLNSFGAKFMFGSEFEEEYMGDDVILLVMLTLWNICGQHQIQLFLEDAIVKNYTLNGTIQYQQLKFTPVIDQSNQMILLEDADLYAVINYLRVKESIFSYLYEIWVQECRKQKFLWLVEEYLKNFSSHICVFRSTKELLTACSHSKMQIKEVLFINTHMDFCGGIALLPYGKIFGKTLYTLSYERQNFDIDNYKIKSEISELKIPIYDLFYYGEWQRPVKNTYWIYNETLWAHATSDDIKRCIDSAEKGFKIWSTKSIASRKQVLSKFAFVLQSKGNFLLADRVLKWIKYVDQTFMILRFQSRRLEITKTRKPRGVIILKEKDETVLFDRLTQILISDTIRCYKFIVK
ncbi:hypothetical protein RF55_14600 [Lasius niger]|uniref:Aldehyde dehydrogenase domain-containing protein n=1 Tax=Lasius niger TaxID=67767 RepID=A0A0J7K7S3_LASNI|nr:hypothetical protein RF55_14600 [Lasius niger]